MKPGQYEAYIKWRDNMVDLSEDLDEDEAAHTLIWDATDPEARDDFNLLLAFMTLDQRAERPLQQRQFQRAIQAHRHRQVVGCAVRVQLPEKPHALLRVGQRLAILNLHPCRNRKPGKVHAFFLQGLQEQLAFFQGQPDKPASKFQGVFSIHFLESGAIGRKHKGTSSL